MIRIESLKVIYDKTVTAVDEISFSIKKGEFVGIIGSSGSGKSSLLKSLNRLIYPTAGKIFIDGIDLLSLNNKNLRHIRREIGFIFQDFNLIDRLTVLENVLIGKIGYKSFLTSFFGIYSPTEYSFALEAIEKVELSDKIFERADQLSGGQQQRVAIAKALCQEPKLILADEPVSSLDINTSITIMDYFKRINEKKDITILINLHNVDLAKLYCKRIIALKKGKTLFNGKPEDLSDDILTRIYS